MKAEAIRDQMEAEKRHCRSAGEQCKAANKRWQAGMELLSALLIRISIVRRTKAMIRDPTEKSQEP